MTANSNSSISSEELTLRLALPKGRIQEGVLSLLKECGIKVSISLRSYRPRVTPTTFEAKVLKPQSVVDMLALGSRDVGFTGLDWVKEKGADVVELLDTGLDPVRLVAAAPIPLLEDGKLPSRALVVASEYPGLTQAWLKKRGQNDTFFRTHGATEVFPPEDADCIVDNTSTGATLEANGLRIVDTLMRSSTRMFASQAAMADPARRTRIEELTMLVRSVLDARKRVMVELNVSSAQLDAVVKLLPCMRKATVAHLADDEGYAVKVAVPHSDLPGLVPKVRAAGGCDIVVSRLTQIIS